MAQFQGHERAVNSKALIVEPKQTTWIVELEEDPETGDLIMPLPMELMASLGWNIGDTLVWNTDEQDKTVKLTKKK